MSLKHEGTELNWGCPNKFPVKSVEQKVNNFKGQLKICTYSVSGMVQRPQDTKVDENKPSPHHLRDKQESYDSTGSNCYRSLPQEQEQRELWRGRLWEPCLVKAITAPIYFWNITNRLRQ
jgi:hypothetical protein